MISPFRKFSCIKWLPIGFEFHAKIHKINISTFQQSQKYNKTEKNWGFRNWLYLLLKDAVKNETQLRN